jgi:hypothetical protein
MAAAAPHEGHDQHLCNLVEHNMLKDKLGDYKKLVKKAKFICTGCGRTAVDAKSLCAPQKM